MLESTPQTPELRMPAHAGILAAGRAEDAPSVPKRSSDEILGLTILYDEHCGLCLRVKDWMSHQPTAVPMRLLGARSEQAIDEYGMIPALGEDLVVVGTDGSVWWGSPGAYLMCLWGLARWRSTAHRLAQPRWRPYAEAFFKHIAMRRHRISAILSVHECETCTAAHIES